MVLYSHVTALREHGCILSDVGQGAEIGMNYRPSHSWWAQSTTDELCCRGWKQTGKLGKSKVALGANHYMIATFESPRW